MKRLILLISVLLMSVSVFSQKTDRMYDKVVVNLGVSSKNDFSVLVGGDFYKHLYGGLEYTRNTEVHKQNMLVGLGYGSNRAVILAKGGLCYTDVKYDTYMTFFDYGLEYLWILDTSKSVTLCYGISATRWTGVQVKLGVSF